MPHARSTSPRSLVLVTVWLVACTPSPARRVEPPTAAQPADAAPARSEATAPTATSVEADAASARAAELAANDARILAAAAEIEAKAAQAATRWTPALEQHARKLMATRWRSTGAAMKAILGSPHRQPDSASRDPWRHPAQTLAFFGITPKMRVFEVGPGGGWWTELLAPLLAAQGKLSIATWDARDDPSARAQYRARTSAALLASAPLLYGKIERIPNVGLKFEMGPDASLDAIMVMRMTQNMMLGGGLEPFLAEAYAALVPGGILAIEQHRAPASMTTPQHPELGYLPEGWLVEQVTAAGFELVARSELNANPKDTKDHPKGVWALPPTYADGDVDRARYEAIGESDRMTLKFMKPTAAAKPASATAPADAARSASAAAPASAAD
ncbi:MAG: class I SAM-dependent methyltransferase [Deltaproteobacteria bacterium]|nr:class I SAM-dependent methyltransferase [Deltaproteobacteria bacterium]MBK8715968.1 class I SAM-dependent methyltransferase [Deltaproteobacteria bacterium]